MSESARASQSLPRGARSAGWEGAVSCRQHLGATHLILWLLPLGPTESAGGGCTAGSNRFPPQGWYQPLARPCLAARGQQCAVLLAAASPLGLRPQGSICRSRKEEPEQVASSISQGRAAGEGLGLLLQQHALAWHPHPHSRRGQGPSPAVSLSSLGCVMGVAESPRGKGTPWVCPQSAAGSEAGQMLPVGASWALGMVCPAPGAPGLALKP